MDVDLAIVGAGGAGLSLVLALDRLAAVAGRSRLTIALVDPVHRVANDRTWCFWDRAASKGSPAADAVHRSWSQVLLVDRAGRERVLSLDDLRYLMVRSADLYALADAAAERLGVTRVLAAVDAVSDDGTDRATVHAAGQEIRARWVFDSRPSPARLPGNVTLLQHFRGWTVRFDRPGFDPDLPVLMDFSVPQPPRGVAFGYVLPSDACTGLVEYTEFSRTRLAGDAYEQALRDYLARRWAGAGYTVEEVEDGAIPMTDAVFARRVGRRVFRLGTAGGATRPSTGYTFAAMQRQATTVAAALLAGRDPEPPAPHQLRHRWMDAVLLQAIDRGYLDGADLFTRLFAGNRPARVLDFLDGATSLGQDLALMRTAPLLPMTRATVDDAAARIRRRVALRREVPTAWVPR